VGTVPLVNVSSRAEKGSESEKASRDEGEQKRGEGAKVGTCETMLVMKEREGGWEVKNRLDLRDGERSETVQQAKGKSCAHLRDGER